MYRAANRPTLYFIGVTTAQSSIMRVFPRWAAHLNLGDARLCGIDFPLHAKAQTYREAVAFIKSDPLSLGALITTHKLDLFTACRDLFDVIEGHAQLMAETSCLSKRAGQLMCHAKDPISAGLAIDGFLAQGHFAKTGGALFCLGAGGAAIAITWHLMHPKRGADRPSRIVVSDRSVARLDHIKAIHAQLQSDIPITYSLIQEPSDNDRLMSQLCAGSFVINATGLGKDAPGSPLTQGATFPAGAIAWDLNYRGDLLFLKQAKAQQTARSLQVEDGWTYFIHGWAQVIAEVFGIAMPVSGPAFEAISAIAAQETGREAGVRPS
ncbi:MAG: shikimate dehydrogenase [Rhodobacteraceae bacterium]|nr:shikimate dehydrogenase [Paracoccaceae bacterium]